MICKAGRDFLVKLGIRLVKRDSYQPSVLLGSNIYLFVRLNTSQNK